MGSASGAFKQVAYKVESVYGVAPSASSAQSLRLVKSNLDLTKDTYQSNEKRSDLQLSDYRHGVRKSGGTIEGELSAKTYSDFFAAALKKPFSATSPITGASITIAGTAGAWTITRAAGSFLADGVKIGDVVRLTAGSFNVANINKNILVTNVTPLVITGMVLNASVLVAEGPIASATVTIVGKKSLIPQSGHTDLSYSIEQWFSDIGASEVYTGQKVSKVSVNLPSTGMATCNIEFSGKDVIESSSQYFTSPTAQTTTGNMAAVNGILRVGGVVVASVTGLSIDIASPQSGEAVVGSNTISSQAAGRVIVSGQMTIIFDSTTIRDAFYNETEISLYAVFTADNSPASDFVAFSIPRIKVGGAQKSDDDKTIIQTIPYQALLNINGGTLLATDLTTISIQDSAA